LKFHNAGFKLQMLAHYYWLTRDAAFLDSVQEKSTLEVKKILEGRENESGLFPREQYCGDIFTQVYSLHSNGAGWRGLRDFAAVLEDVQAVQIETPSAPFNPVQLRQTAADFRKAILSAAEKSERQDGKLNFIPVALYGAEKPYDPLTATKLGSYWDLIAPYMLGSGMFGPGSARERAIIDYLQERGGVCMGMIRFDQHSGLFANTEAVDDLYSLRYTIKLLELDEVDRALVSFYGKLAQGLTRDTFIGAEGTGLRPLDALGRSMYLPPNSSANAFFLWTLRYLLVQDWDTDDNGTPDTLRLCFATPRAWLEDGKSIKVSEAPTAFGPISMRIHSSLSKGKIDAELDLPTRNQAQRTLFRVRLPTGWKAVSCQAGKLALNLDNRGTVDISALKGHTSLTFKGVHLATTTGVRSSSGAAKPGMESGS